MGFIAQILLFLGGIIASWFVSTEVTNFIAYQIAFHVTTDCRVSGYACVSPVVVTKAQENK